MMKRSTWLGITLSCLSLSILSMFLPVLTYVQPDGTEQAFNIVRVMQQDELAQILGQYTGSFVLEIDKSVLSLLAVIALLAVAAAFAGVITMSAQRPNNSQFVLAVVGLVGTMIPSILIFAAVILSKSYFPGSFHFGAYPVITPITMGICIYMVGRKHRYTKAELEAQRRAAEQLHALTEL